MPNSSQATELANFFGLERPISAVTRLADSLDQRLPSDWRLVAATIAESLRPSGEPVDVPMVLGISGGQGAGKTTLGRALVQAFEQQGLIAATCSLDDFYLSKAERQYLASQVHPLLATRGVPGTHHVEAAAQLLDDCHRGADLLVPQFDKAMDDITPRSKWRRYKGPVQRLVFEGWCLGVPPQPENALAEPVNTLEREQDTDGSWRRRINEVLADSYIPLWQRLDRLLYLAVPNIDAVRRWRTEQEQNLPESRRMSDAAIRQFIAHYERLTRWMLVSMPARATWTLPLGVDHRIAWSELDSFRSGSVRTN